MEEMRVYSRFLGMERSKRAGNCRAMNYGITGFGGFFDTSVI